MFADVAGPTERLDIVNIVRIAAVLEFDDVVTFELSSPATFSTPPVVARERPQPRQRPPASIKCSVMAAAGMTTAHETITFHMKAWRTMQ